MKKETNSVTGLTSSDFSRTASEEETQPENEETEETTENAGENVQTFEEIGERYGNNLTETLFVYGDFGTIYKAFCYNPSCTGGNGLLGESDARGGETVYTVALETSRNRRSRTGRAAKRSMNMTQQVEPPRSQGRTPPAIR